MFKRVVWLMILVVVIQLVRGEGEDLPADTDESDWNRSCLPGEFWYEGCTNCVCSNHGTAECEDPEQRFCVSGACSYPSAWYIPRARCHCSTHNTRICIPVVEQRSLHNQPCHAPGAYFYDDCIRCDCLAGERTYCEYSSCKDVLSLCNPGDLISEICRRCECTPHMYQVCRPIPNCTMVGYHTKPGECPKSTEIRLGPIQRLWCLLTLRHSCLKDIDCLGEKKCCLKGCYFTCMDPVY